MTSPAAERGVRWREVVLFTFIAYALTWGWNAIWIVPHLGTLLTAPATPTDATAIYGNQVNSLPGMFGPLLAAVAMRLWVSSEGLRGSLGLRQRWQAYVVALAAPIVFVAVAGLVLVLTGFGMLTRPAEPFTSALVGLLAGMLVLECALGLGEEYGWRGYLLPRLIPLGEIPATLILGVVWGLWHFPVVLAGVLIGGHPLWLVAPIHVAVIVLASFPYTWLARATRFSPIIAAILHGSTNWAQQRFLTILILGNAVVGLAALGFGWLVVVVAAYGFGSWRCRGRVHPC